VYVHYTQPDEPAVETVPKPLHERHDHSFVIDLSADEEDDELPVKKEDKNENHDIAPTNEVTSNDLQPQPIPGHPTKLMTEFGAMIGEVVNEYGVDALRLPEVKRLKSRMAEAAKLDSREMLCHYYGLLNATLLSCD
jgi:hypothetical protein